MMSNESILNGWLGKTIVIHIQNATLKELPTHKTESRWYSKCVQDNQLWPSLFRHNQLVLHVCPYFLQSFTTITNKVPSSVLRRPSPSCTWRVDVEFVAVDKRCQIQPIPASQLCLQTVARRWPIEGTTLDNKQESQSQRQKLLCDAT